MTGILIAASILMTIFLFSVGWVLAVIRRPRR